MTSLRMLAPMDIHQPNDEHDKRYYPSKHKYPNEDSNDPFELFECPYFKDHRITSKRWRIHLQKCKENYGGDYVKCVFNASHHIPAPAIDYHYQICPDKDIIRQDIEGSTSNWKLSTQVNHNPEWNEPDTGECWDDEIDDDAEEFSIDVNKGMPLSLMPQVKDGEYVEESEEDNYENEASGSQVPSVLMEEPIPEKPRNWNEMTKAQKKNYKRKYERQRLRMEEEGVTEEDFARVKSSKVTSETARQDKLAAVKAMFAVSNDKMNATRVDYTSLLNIICQRSKINLPEYQPCSSLKGGFAYKCRVGLNWYQGKAFSSTKKDAKHDSAKEAILGMEIPGIDTVAPEKTMPINPKLLDQSSKLREGDELAKLMQAGMYSPKKNVSLRQPKVDIGVANSQQGWNMSTNSQLKPHVPLEDIRNEDEKQDFNDQLNEGDSMEKYIQQNEKKEKVVVDRDNQKASSMEQYIQMKEQQRREKERSSSQPPVPKCNPSIQTQQTPITWNGWGAPAQKQSVNSNNSNSNQLGNVQRNMNAMSISNGVDFPSLGRSNLSQSVAKKPGISSGKVTRVPGRGRGTTMKL